MTSDMLPLRAKPAILIASSDPTRLHEIDSALWSNGYRVVLAGDDRQTLEQARTQRPHAIVLDAGMPPGHVLCDALRKDPDVAPGTPILLTQNEPVTREQQLHALRAGAWDLHGTPLDLEALLARLAVYVQVRFEVDHLSAACLVDRPSGLYNLDGFERRGEELGALTTRQGLALACAVFRPARALAAGPAADRLAHAFKTAGRLSDAIGRTASTEVAVYAPATTALAAARLVHRLSGIVERELGTPSAVRAGYSAVLPSHTVSPPTLLARARSALEAAHPTRRPL